VARILRAVGVTCSDVIFQTKVAGCPILTYVEPWLIAGVIREIPPAGRTGLMEIDVVLVVEAEELLPELGGEVAVPDPEPDPEPEVEPVAEPEEEPVAEPVVEPEVEPELVAD
jgi:hypothetical protein